MSPVTPKPRHARLIGGYFLWVGVFAGLAIAGSIWFWLSRSHQVAHRAGNAVAKLPAVMELPKITAQYSRRSVVQDDPRADGWQSETLSEAAAAQLKAVAKLLEHPDQIDESHVAERIVDDFTCDALRPQDLSPVYDDRVLTVVRGKPVERDAATATGTHQGGRGLVTALVALAEPLRAASQIRTAIKLFRLEPVAEGLATTAYYESCAHTAASSVQQNAIWRARWRIEGEELPRLEWLGVEQFEETTANAATSTLFSDCTKAVLGANSAWREQLIYGADHWGRRMEMTVATDWWGHQGITVGDVNSDGLEDVYVCQPGGVPNRLFIQQTDGTALDRSAAAGVDWLDRTSAALLIDLDNDGDQDLALTAMASLLIMANDGRGNFSIMATLPVNQNVYSLAAADFDQDRDLDIYVCIYAPDSRHVGEIGNPLPYHDANNGAPNVLYRNEGNWQFSDATQEVGLDENNRRFSYAAAWEDFDNDGDQDLYVANDYGRKNLFRNDGGHFVDVAAAADVEDSGSGMAVAWGDYNRDGLMDLYVSNMFSSAGNRITYQEQFQTEATSDVRQRIQRFAKGNSLFRNRGDGTFEDVSEQSATTMGRWAWGSAFVDLNNDAWEDIVVTNGYLTRSDPGDL